MDILPKLSPSIRRRALRNAAGMALLCVLASLTVTSVVLNSIGIDPTPAGYAVAAIVPALCATPICFWLFTRIEHVRLAYTQLDQVASRDWLTQCLNRRAFTTAATHLAPETSTSALLVLDIDNFKRVNDQYGHDQGDEALRLVAEEIRRVARSEDIVGRLGGEEFGILMARTTPENCRRAAERIREAILKVDFRPQGRTYPLSVSIGAAVGPQSVAFDQMFQIADKRLYEAKRAGRNRVEMAVLEKTPIAA